MKILFCYRNWMNPTLGGVQRVTDTIARYLADRGHDIHYLTYEFDENDQYRFPGRIHRLPETDFYCKGNIKYYHQLLKSFGIDVVINNDAANERSRFFLNTGENEIVKFSVYHTDPLHELYHPIAVSNYFRNKLLISLFGSILRKLIQWNRYNKKKRQIKWLLRKSTKLLLISEAHKEKINEVLNIDSKAISVMYNPSAFSERKLRTTYQKIILFVGRIDLPVKRPDLLLQIWQKVESDFPDWKLFFLGDGPDMNAIQEMNQTLGLKNTKFLGYTDPEKYYKEASILCMTSEYEGFPSVLVEAMHFGLVPIAFNNWSSLSEVIIDNKTGMTVDRGDISQYILKLRSLMSDSEILVRISDQAVDHVKKYDIEEIGPKWDVLLSSFSSIQ
jgi:glycosyltransferase involved in cell wall biosynthesis